VGWLWQILGAVRAVATAGEPGKVLFCFFSRKQLTISPISCRENFTKFEHNMLIDVAMKTFGTELLEILPYGVVFTKNKFLIFLTFSDFRPP